MRYLDGIDKKHYGEYMGNAITITIFIAQMCLIVMCSTLIHCGVMVELNVVSVAINCVFGVINLKNIA